VKEVQKQHSNVSSTANEKPRAEDLEAHKNKLPTKNGDVISCDIFELSLGDVIPEEHQPKKLDLEPADTKEKTEVKVEGEPKSQSTVAQNNPKLMAILEKERRIFPWERYVDFLIILVGILFISLLRGTSSLTGIAQVEYCEAEYWVIYVMVIPVAILLHIRGMHVVKKADKMRVEAGYDFGNNFRITPEKIPKLRYVSLITGILAAVVGIGGGLLMIPIMMEWGLQSLAAAATSGFFVVFTSFSSLFLVLISGDV